MKTEIAQFTKVINDEFQKIWGNLQIHLKEDIDIGIKKRFLSSHVPKEVMHASEILLDTVINALMDEASLKLKDTPIDLQNRFYDYNLRERVEKWSSQVHNKLSLEPEYVKYSKDPQLVEGLIAAGATFFVASASIFATASMHGLVSIPPTIVEVIVSGMVTLILSALAFKFAYDKAKPKAISAMTKDIELYLENSKKQVIDWLEKVILKFNEEFKSFCDENGVGGQ